MWNKYNVFHFISDITASLRLSTTVSEFHLSFCFPPCTDKVQRVRCRAAAEAGVAGEHHVWDLRGDPAGDEEGEGLPGAVRQGGRQ